MCKVGWGKPCSFCMTSLHSGSRLINNEGNFSGLMMGSLVERGSAGASKTLTSNVPRLWCLQDGSGTLTRPAILWEVSKNFLLLVRQKERDEEKSKNNFISFGEFSIIFVVQDRFRKCQACNKCHLFGSAVGRQMVRGPAAGGDETVGVVWRKSFIRLFHNTFNNCSLTSANSC